MPTSRMFSFSVGVIILIAFLVFYTLTLKAEATQQVIIGSFDNARAASLSLGSGDYFDQARSSLSTIFSSVAITSFSELTSTVISDVDILFLSTANANANVGTPLSQNEQDTLLDFVKSGGCAILFPENDTYDAEADAANESLVDPFGMDITGTIPGPVTVNITDTSRSLVTNGPYGVISSYTQNFPGGITNIGQYDVPLASNRLGNAIVIIPRGIIQPGSGAVIIFSDITAFQDNSSQGYFSVNEPLFLNSIFYCMANQQVYLPLITR